ncbi:MAG: NADP-dependent isocitrate dehydrogenase, partial [Alphaproteobacteria bacterium]|nr:NADP-dependent isocitrate dehydrogenase [Alphaproteobacteria bacterium]
GGADSMAAVAAFTHDHRAYEGGEMTKDLALLAGPDQGWLSTTGFLDAVDRNLKRELGA